MGSWPWPLDAVEKWFQGLWDWVGKAAVTAVGAVSKWITDGIAGLWKTVSGAFTSLGKVVTDWFSQIWKWIQNSFTAIWDNVSAGLSGLGKQVTNAFSAAWTSISDALSLVQTGVTDFVTTAWDGISGAVNVVGTALGQGLTDLGGAVGGFFGDLWTKTTDFLTTFWNDVSGSIGAIGTAISGAVTGFNDLVNGLLTGLSVAMGAALQQVVTGVTSTLTTVVPEVMRFVDQNFIQPAAAALRWILDFVSGLFRDFYDSFVSTLRGIGFGTPEGAAVLAVPLLLTSISAIFVMGTLGAVGDIKIMGCGIQLSSLTNQLIAAFGITQLSTAVIAPILSAAYGQPVRYYWNSVFRPYIVSTGQADQMFFEENISEAEWHQVYAYNGWKERDIAAWGKTMWREPSLLVLRNLLLDPDTDEAWIRKKMRENGLVGEDADAMFGYGRRQATKDERASLASQIEKDVVEGFESFDEARSDLALLKYTPQETEYRIAKYQFLIDRADRAAAAKAAKAKAPSKKGVTESDLDLELQLGLIAPGDYTAGLQQLDFSLDAAQRKYRLLVTPRPVSASELSRRKTVVEGQIAKTTQRYELVLARQDLDAGFYSDMIEYLSSLEKPPETRIVTLAGQLNKLAGERSLVIQQREFELADLRVQLGLVEAG